MIDAASLKILRDRFHERGISVRGWAEANGFPPATVYQVLGGRVACRRGKSHEIAVKLGLKPLVEGEPTLDPQLASESQALTPSAPSLAAQPQTEAAM
jgi:gp16 family phage-associated protein